MKISEAAAAGIKFIRKPAWAPGEVLELTLINGGYGPWATLHGLQFGGPGDMPKYGSQTMFLHDDRRNDWLEAPAPLPTEPAP